MFAPNIGKNVCNNEFQNLYFATDIIRMMKLRMHARTYWLNKCIQTSTNLNWGVCEDPCKNGTIILKCVLNKWGELYSSDRAGFCEDGIELSVSVKFLQYLGWLSDCRFLKECTPPSWLVRVCVHLLIFGKSRHSFLMWIRLSRFIQLKYDSMERNPKWITDSRSRTQITQGAFPWTRCSLFWANWIQALTRLI